MKIETNTLQMAVLRLGSHLFLHRSAKVRSYLRIYQRKKDIVGEIFLDFSVKKDIAGEK